MSHSIETLALEDPRWSAFVGDHPGGLVFHHPSWAALLADCYGYRPFALAVPDGRGEIQAGLPVLDVSGPLTGRRWVSLPFTDYCPPLGAGELAASGQLTASLAALVHARGVAALEVRAALPGGAHLGRLEAVRHLLALGPEPDAVYRSFSKMHQRNIRKAEKSALRVELGSRPADLERFYRLHLLTRQRLGVPIQPRRFFRLLGKGLLARGLGFVLTVHHDEVPIAAAVFLACNGTLIYKYGASDARYWEHRPNNLLFWRAIQWGCEHGYHTFDWGRTDLEDRGLRDFKCGWGAREEPLAYATFRPGAAGAAAVPKRATDGTGRLRGAMGAVIRRSPPLVCRAIGELFYKYAA